MQSRIVRQLVAMAGALSLIGATPVLGAGSPSPDVSGGTWFDGLDAGLCFDGEADGSIDFLKPALIVSCDGPHLFQIAARASMGDGAFPSGDLGTLALAACAPAYEAFLGRKARSNGLPWTQVWPDASDWDKGVHDALCLVGGSQPMVGTAASGSLLAPGETLAVYHQPAATSELWLADAGTGELVRQLAAGRTDLLLSPPHWTPDGTGLAVTVAVSDDDVDAWLLPVDGTTASALVTGPGKQEAADLSGDGTLVAFSSNVGLPASNIFTREVAGGTPIDRSRYDGKDASPQWSPDGAQLLFRRVTNDISDIWVMNADGTDQRQLTANGAGNYDPRWSPDGTQVLFTTNLGGDYDIWVMNADGTDQRLLTDHPADDEYPTWSRDGELIAFQSARYGGPAIWLMRADGSDASLLLAQQPTGYPMFAPVEVAGLGQ